MLRLLCCNIHCNEEAFFRVSQNICETNANARKCICQSEQSERANTLKYTHRIALYQLIDDFNVGNSHDHFGNSLFAQNHASDDVRKKITMFGLKENVFDAPHANSECIYENNNNIQQTHIIIKSCVTN